MWYIDTHHRYYHTGMLRLSSLGSNPMLGFVFLKQLRNGDVIYALHLEHPVVTHREIDGIDVSRIELKLRPVIGHY